MSIVGDWHIDYVETYTKTIISFYPDGTFYQQAGRYVGRWFQQQNVNSQQDMNLTLKFDTLTLPYEVGPITLDAQIKYDFKSFSGTKPNKAYAGGVLHYNASLMTLNPTPKPTDIDALLPIQVQTQVQQNQTPVNCTPANIVSEDDNDSPCQVRRTRR